MAEDAQIAATFLRTGRTQVFQPSICDKGWSLFGPFCYKHFWDKRPRPRWTRGSGERTSDGCW